MSYIEEEENILCTQSAYIYTTYTHRAVDLNVGARFYFIGPHFLPSTGLVSSRQNAHETKSHFALDWLHSKLNPPPPYVFLCASNSWYKLTPHHRSYTYVSVVCHPMPFAWIRNSPCRPHARGKKSIVDSLLHPSLIYGIYAYSVEATQPSLLYSAVGRPVCWMITKLLIRDWQRLS